MLILTALLSQVKDLDYEIAADQKIVFLSLYTVHIDTF